MNKKTYHHTHQEEENERRIFFSNFAVSFLLHLVFFVVLVFAPGYATNRNPSPSVINVNLVALPSQNKATVPAEFKTQTAVEKKDEKTTTSPKTTPKTDHKPQEPVSLEPKKKKVKQSLKKKHSKPTGL